MSPTTLTGSTVRGVSGQIAGLALLGLAVFVAVWFAQREESSIPIAPSGSPPPTPELMVISFGAADYLLLEWTSDPAPANTTWQYRQRTWENYQPLPWGAWTNIPNSDASTRTYRVSGLSPDLPYDYEVRARSVTTKGEASNVGEGHTYHAGTIPYIGHNQIVEGDGLTEWRFFHTNLIITIPNGMRLRDASGGPGAGGKAGVGIYDATTGSYLTFDIFTLEEAGREILSPPSEGPQGASRIVNRDVDALFDQIVASVRWEQYR